MNPSLGGNFAKSLARKDRAGLLSLLADDVDFRGMTPGRFWEAGSATELVDAILLGAWFEPQDEITSLQGVDEGSFADRGRLSYRFSGHNPSGPFVVEQQAYFIETDGRIGWLRVMCSGFRASEQS